MLIKEILINEQAQKLMGYQNPLGKTVNLGETKTKIVGVVKDFHFKPLDKKIRLEVTQALFRLFV